ncbi:hypothetical protein [Roseomonas fluvialis]|uniref:Ferric oxidoreductase domain-containing protein n=1 Tax=Roseomonas fluvialis TaxID=1750527 RepID=A0ABM7XY64_9PROT|nr:hypothetical protein [Roseomonas fluvialis]BDG70363.1 hypothetical protein Rmf_02920 [Roseomonas fluvialis]
MAGGLGEILGGVATALLALGLAVLLARLAGAAFAIAAPHDAEAVPLLRLLAIWSGFSFGLALVLAAPHSAMFTPGRLLAAEGPWSEGLPTLLGTHALPHAESFAALPGALMGASVATAILAWLALLGFAHGSLTALRLWRGRPRRRAFAAFLMLVLHTALLAHYSAYLLGWFAAQLGPWLFALALLAFQHWRYAVRPAH